MILQDPTGGLGGAGNILDLVGSGTQSIGMLAVVIVFVRYMAKRDEQQTSVIEKVATALERQQQALSKQEDALDSLFREVRETRQEARCRAAMMQQPTAPNVQPTDRPERR